MVRRWWMRFKRARRRAHPCETLEMGLIRACSMIIPRTELASWLARGWVEVPDFHDFHYAPGPGETVVLARPPRLSEIGVESLIGRTIVDYGASYGTYGMGGPGFVGFVLSESESRGREVLVYAVWGAGGYTRIDGRVMECHPRFYATVRPWASNFAEEQGGRWDDLAPLLPGCRIEAVDLGDETCLIAVTGESGPHQIELLRNDPSLPRLEAARPHGCLRDGGDRRHARASPGGGRAARVRAIEGKSKKAHRRERKDRRETLPKKPFLCVLCGEMLLAFPGIMARDSDYRTDSPPNETRPRP